MRILHVHETFCIRAVKECIALTTLGHDVYIAFREISPIGIDPQIICKKGFIFEKAFHVLVLIKKLNPDIIHVHNEPNRMGVLLMSSNLNIPVIFDCHDMSTMRTYRVTQEDKDEERRKERYVMENADGLVFCSSGLDAYARKKYNVKANSIILHSRYNKFFIKHNDANYEKDSIVYQGGLTNRDQREALSYRDYWKIFDKIALQKFKVGVYTLSDVDRSVEEDNVTIHKSLSYNKLIKEISKYQWGFVGFNLTSNIFINNFLHSAIPNKFYDYICAGVPVIIHNCEAMSNYIKSYNVGFTCNQIEELREKINKIDYDDLRKDIRSKQQEFSMENNINPLIELYMEAL